VRVGVTLGLGETVQVGDFVLVGVLVYARIGVFVLLGEIVHVGIGLGIAVKLQAVSTHAVNIWQHNRFSCFLFGNVVQGGYREKRVMIADLAF
jgi:hypothetical protein